jgi:chromosome segregation ATPase
LEDLRAKVALKQQEADEQFAVLQPQETEMAELKDRASKIERRLARKRRKVEVKEQEALEVQTWTEQQRTAAELQSQLGGFKAEYQTKLATLRELQRTEKEKRDEVAEEEAQLEAARETVRRLHKNYKRSLPLPILSAPNFCTNSPNRLRRPRWRGTLRLSSRTRSTL